MDENPGLPLRLLGVGLAKLTSDEQLGLFDGAPDEPDVDSAIDDIHERYGDQALVPARSLR
jgi:hypothetical protein